MVPFRGTISLIGTKKVPVKSYLMGQCFVFLFRSMLLSATLTAAGLKHPGIVLQKFADAGFLER